MRRLDAARRAIRAGAALLLALAFAVPADARKFQMSGTWVVRTGSIFLPLQFAAVLMGPQMTKTSMGDLSNAYFIPNGPIYGGGGVTATGSGPATLRIPRHRFVQDFMTALPLPNPELVQLATSIGVDAPWSTATLEPGAGPGSFTWCVDVVDGPDPGCVKGTAMDPIAPNDGRILYVEGANRFGGSMAIGLRRGGTISGVYGSSPIQLSHRGWVGVGGGSALRQLAVGRLGSADAPVVHTHFHEVGPVTQPIVAPPMGSVVLFPGPRVTTMGGLTTTGTGPPVHLPTVATGPNGTPASAFTTSFGFGHTTGTVIAQQTTGSNPGDDFFTFMGTDLRTPLGAGNIQTVAGGIGFRNGLLGGATYATVHKVWLTLGPPIPTLSPAGFAVAAALMLLAVGYGRRRL